jgi:hypothetical protein
MRVLKVTLATVLLTLVDTVGQISTAIEHLTLVARERIHNISMLKRKNAPPASLRSLVLDGTTVASTRQFFTREDT